MSQILADALGAVAVYKDVYSQSDAVLPFKPIFEKTLKEFVTIIDEAQIFIKLRQAFEQEDTREKMSQEDTLTYEKIKNSWTFPDYLKTDEEMRNYLKAKELFIEKVRNSRMEESKKDSQEKEKSKDKQNEETNTTDQSNDDKTVKVEQEETAEDTTTKDHSSNDESIKEQKETAGIQAPV